jgi:acetyl-CoA carboxylase biotin carboxylase subunit
MGLLTPRGHAIECRIYAEDPDTGFMPSPGRIAALTAPGGPFVRDDSGAEAGGEVPIFYDPLISKLSVWGSDRPQAIARMQRALREYDVRGIRTTVPFFRWMLAQRPFQDGEFHTATLDELLQQREGEPFSTPDEDDEEVAAIAAALHAFERGSVSPGIPVRLKPDATCAAARMPYVVSGFSRTGVASWKHQARLEALRV